MDARVHLGADAPIVRMRWVFTDQPFLPLGSYCVLMNRIWDNVSDKIQNLSVGMLPPTKNNYTQDARWKLPAGLLKNHMCHPEWLATGEPWPNDLPPSIIGPEGWPECCLPSTAVTAGAGADIIMGPYPYPGPTAGASVAVSGLSERVTGGALVDAAGLSEHATGGALVDAAGLSEHATGGALVDVTTGSADVTAGAGVDVLFGEEGQPSAVCSEAGRFLLFEATTAPLGPLATLYWFFDAVSGVRYRLHYVQTGPDRPNGSLNIFDGDCDHLNSLIGGYIFLDANPEFEVATSRRVWFFVTGFTSGSGVSLYLELAT